MEGEQNPRKVHGSSCALRASFRIELPLRICRRDRKTNKQGPFWWTHKGSNLGPLPCEGNACTKVFSQLVADLVRVRKFSAGKRTRPISRAPLLCRSKPLLLRAGIASEGRDQQSYSLGNRAGVSFACDATYAPFATPHPNPPPVESSCTRPPAPSTPLTGRRQARHRAPPRKLASRRPSRARGTR